MTMFHSKLLGLEDLKFHNLEKKLGCRIPVEQLFDFSTAWSSSYFKRMNVKKLVTMEINDTSALWSNKVSTTLSFPSLAAMCKAVLPSYRDTKFTLVLTYTSCGFEISIRQLMRTMISPFILEFLFWRES